MDRSSAAPHSAYAHVASARDFSCHDIINQKFHGAWHRGVRVKVHHVVGGHADSPLPRLPCSSRHRAHCTPTLHHPPPPILPTPQFSFLYASMLCILLLLLLLFLFITFPFVSFFVYTFSERLFYYMITFFLFNLWKLQAIIHERKSCCKYSANKVKRFVSS